MSGPMPTPIVSVIPPHLDSATVRWLADVSTAGLHGMRRHAKHELKHNAKHREERHALELRLQEIEFVLQERGPLAQRIRSAAALMEARKRELDEARAAEQRARLAYEAAICAHLHLQGMQDTITEETA